MANTLSPQVLAQLFAQESNDPFLTLLTLTHPSLSTIYLVNNTQNIISRGNTFLAFPFNITLPMDDGETQKELSLELDNVSLALVESIRTVIDPINVKLEMILASLPDAVQYEMDELKIQSLSYNRNRISAKLILDDFLNVEIPGEKYDPTTFPGLF